jgi:hypothetical protein
MSCEIFCCEIPELLHFLSDDTEDKMLLRLFSILDSPDRLDNYLAGYFEKVLEMLFRRMTVQVMRLLNREGPALTAKFLDHIDNYSVMQVVQRLLLPHIPFAMAAADAEPLSAQEKEQLTCHWSYAPDTCRMLCDRMLLPVANSDVPAHIADLLITVLQLSAPDADFLTNLCDSTCLSALVSAIVAPGSDAVIGVSDTPSPAVARSLASVSVLESLVSKLCEVVGPLDAAGLELPPEQVTEAEEIIQRNTARLVVHMVPVLSLVADQLRALTKTTSTDSGTMQMQDKREVPRLGHRALQLVKLLESLIRIDDARIDAVLISSKALDACIDLIFIYEMNSLLHLSVQRLLVLILEGGLLRRYCLADTDNVQRLTDSTACYRPAQEHLLLRCELLPRIMATVRALGRPGEKTLARSPVVGHLVQLGHILCVLVDPPQDVDATAAPSPERYSHFVISK